MLNFYFRFYGKYHVTGTKWSTLVENLNACEELNQEYKLKKEQKSENRDIAGIFLTPLQKVIVESDQPYLHIIGLPGTGKTYCLLMKMVDVYFDILLRHKQNSGIMNECILVFHLNQETLQFIKKIFWQTIESLLLKKKLKKEEVPVKKLKKEEEGPNKEFIKFISQKFYDGASACASASFIDIDMNNTFQTKDFDLSTKFKVFCYDISSDILNFTNVDKMNEMLVAIDQSNFCWCTSYSAPSILKNFHRPLSVVKVKNNKIYDSSQYVYLSDSLRYSARIHALIDVALNYSETIDSSHLRPHGSRHRPTFHKSNFSCGTRVLGKTNPMLIPVKYNNDIDQKATEFLQNLLEEEQLEENEITVIECVRYESER